MNTQWAGQITIWGFLEKSWRLPWKYFITNLTFERFPFMINCNMFPYFVLPWKYFYHKSHIERFPFMNNCNVYLIQILVWLYVIVYQKIIHICATFSCWPKDYTCAICSWVFKVIKENIVLVWYVIKLKDLQFMFSKRLYLCNMFMFDKRLHL